MRPLRLHLQGFTSFRAAQEVDFSELGLFAITGPTGAGKSSLLDAIALALYGAVPRMGKQGLAELITHGEAQARLELEFAVDGARYRVARRLKRRGPQQATLERLEGDRWESLANEGVRAVDQTIEQLLRLDFESFCKAVMLPQGEFARFLKGDPKERRKALEALLGLDLYAQMRKLATARAGSLSAGVRAVQEILAGPEYLDATAEALSAAEQKASAEERRAQALAEALALAEQQGRLAAALAAAAEQARAGSARLGERAAQLDRLAAACREAELEERAARRASEQARDEAQQAAGARVEAQQKLERLIEQLGTVEQLALLGAAAQALPGRERELQLAQARLAEVEAQQKSCRGELERLAQERERAHQALHAADERAAQAQAQLQAAAERRGNLERELGGLRDAETRLQEAERALEAERRRAEELARSARSAQAKRDAAERTLRELERADMAAALAAGLAAGDPCPVCARPLEAQPQRHRHSLRELDQARAALEAAQDAYDRASTEAARAAGALKQLEANVSVARQQLQRALAGRDGVGQMQAMLARAQAQLAEAEQQAQAAAAEREQALKASAQLDREIARLQERARGLEHQQADARRALEGARRQLEESRVLLQGRFGEAIPADAAARLEADLQLLRDAQGGLDQARAAEAAARDREAEAQLALANVEKLLVRLDAKLDQSRAELEASLAQPGALDPELALPSLPEPIAPRAQHAARLAAFCRAASEALGASAARLARRAAGEGQRVLEIASAHSLAAADPPAALATLRAACQEAQKASGAARASAEALARKLSERERLEQQIRREGARAKVLEELASELRADRFVEFVAQETLNLLAEHASEELQRISAGRYSLRSSDNEFLVVDHDNADERRSVKTLSGGETFMASLAMALALSRHVSDLAGEGMGARLEAVFIDEGFGALDPETLEDVIDALERLREEELLVGVISHVPEVAARIGEGLVVARDGDRSIVQPRGLA